MSRIAVDKPKRPTMKHNFFQSIASSRQPAAKGGSVDRRIRAFLNGETHGEDVLAALYGDVADEPVPERLLAILRS
jgi:hypothetical protein